MVGKLEGGWVSMLVGSASRGFIGQQIIHAPKWMNGG